MGGKMKNKIILKGKKLIRDKIENMKKKNTDNYF